MQFGLLNLKQNLYAIRRFQSSKENTQDVVEKA